MQYLLLIAFGAITAAHTWAHLAIPRRQLGFVYGNGQDSTDVKLAAYIDLTCHDSQTAFRTLLKVADQYKPSQVQLRLYLFSQPNHRNAHTISKAAHVLNAYTSSKGATVYDWFRAVYDNIDSLMTSATVDKTDLEVLNFLANLAYNVSGIPDGLFRAGVSNSDIDQATKLEWKYGCTRGVYATPLFMVNDVFVNADSRWTVKQWTDLLNSLITKQKTTFP